MTGSYIVREIIFTRSTKDQIRKFLFAVMNGRRKLEICGSYKINLLGKTCWLTLKLIVQVSIFCFFVFVILIKVLHDTIFFVISILQNRRGIYISLIGVNKKCYEYVYGACKNISNTVHSHDLLYSETALHTPSRSQQSSNVKIEVSQFSNSVRFFLSTKNFPITSEA